MKRQLHALLALCISSAIIVSGCAPTQPYFFFEDGDLSHYVGLATDIEHPDVETASLSEVEFAGRPITVSDPNFNEIWELELQDAVQNALKNSKVMRTLGGRQASFGGSRPQQDESPETVLRAPQQTPTVYDPAIAESDPNFGVEGALSAFDAQLGSALFWEKNDRPQNINNDQDRDGIPDALEDENPRDGVPDQGLERLGFNRVRRQDLGQFNATLSKRLATGARVAIAANSIYEYSNSGIRELPSDWTQNFELQFSQPLLQGGGLLYNRIAGPFDPFNGTGTPNIDGVLIARIRTDISLADFEAGVRNLVNDVEGAYWNLYFGYRNLEARKVGRNSALATWEKVQALAAQGAKGGEADKEAQAREQYHFFQAEVHTAWSDLLRAERKLRYIMGLEHSDGRLITPVTEPTVARVEFDWNEIHAESLVRSVELRQQRWRIKQRELELMAAKNLLLPRLDLVARHRFLGLGDDLINSYGRGYSASNVDSLADTDAFSTITDGNFQESQIGVQFNMELGFRRALSTVRQQQLNAARERAILREQELELSNQLAEAVTVLDTSYNLMQENLNRVVAAQRQVEAFEQLFIVGATTVDFVLQAQRLLAEALTALYRAQSDYNRNIAQVHLRKGSLLEYNDVYLSEGPWPGKAYFDAHRRARARDAAYYLDYGFERPDVISLGPSNHHGGEMIQQAEIIQGEIWSDGAPIPPNGEPTPAPPPAEMDDGALEELPAPGPATMKPLTNSIRLSAAPRSAARQAIHESEAPRSGQRESSFDWKFDRPARPSRDSSVLKAAAMEDADDDGVRTIRLTAGSEPVPASHQAQHGEMPRQESATASGWKKAKK
ncbi:MAG: TolC family protein [Pirellulales bacterium]